VSGGQIAVAVLAAVLTGTVTPVDKTQKFRVSLVTRPSGDRNVNGRDLKLVCASDLSAMVWNTDNQVTRIEAIDEPAIYQEFFEKLSKSAFLEAQQI